MIRLFPSSSVDRPTPSTGISAEIVGAPFSATFAMIVALSLATGVVVAADTSGHGELPGRPIGEQPRLASIAKPHPAQRRLMRWQGVHGEARAPGHYRELLLFSAEAARPPNMFSGVYETREQGTIGFERRPDAIAWAGANNYVGFWHSPTLDLSQLERIELEINGSIASGDCVDVRIEDVVPGQEIGRIYRSACLELGGRVDKLVLTASDFRKFPHFGEQEGTLDWSNIKTIQIQTGPAPDDFDPYHGAYHDGDWGSITTLDGGGAFVWHGDRCYFGFSFREPLDLTQLEELRASLRGGGEVDLHLIDANDVAYHVADVDLDRGLRTHRFVKDDFTLFPYGEIGVLDWAAIRKIQWQIPDPGGARVAMEGIEVALSGGRSYNIKPSPVGNTSVALHEIAVLVADR